MTVYDIEQARRIVGRSGLPIEERLDVVLSLLLGVQNQLDRHTAEITELRSGDDDGGRL